MKLYPYLCIELLVHVFIEICCFIYILDSALKYVTIVTDTRTFARAMLKQ